MMPPTSIDGTDITGATIDGQDVEEITLDGQTVFTAGPNIPDEQDLIARYDFSQESGSLPVIDRSGSGNDLNTGSFSGVGTTINGVQAGLFDGIDDGLQTVFASGTQSQPNSIFMSFELINYSGGNKNFIDGSSKEEQSVFIDNQDGTYKLLAGTRGPNTFSAQNGDIIVLSAIFDGSNSLIRTNNVEDTGDPGNNSMSGITLASEGDLGRFVNMKIGEVLLYPSDKSSIISDAESYLTAKWGPTVD